MIKARLKNIQKALLLQAILACGLLSFDGFAQQNVQFTQYMFNGLVINPAYAGADEALSITLIHRSQWIGLEGAPQTQTLSGHTLFKGKKVGLGLTLTNDKIGIHKHLNLMTNYAYHLVMSEKSALSFGLQAGFHNRRSDYASLGEDEAINNVNLANTNFDFGFGLYYRSPRFHIGFSIPELLPEKLHLGDSVVAQFTAVNNLLFSKYRFTLNENMELVPSMLIKYLPGLPLSFDLNMNVVYRQVLTAGVSYRKSESLDLIFMGQVTSQLQLGYSFDYPVGEISRVTTPSHEVMVNYLFRYKQSGVTSPRR